jgi:hypothetical protein
MARGVAPNLIVGAASESTGRLDERLHGNAPLHERRSAVR